MIAWIVIGTFWMDSERRVAVTMTSASSVLDPLTAGATDVVLSAVDRADAAVAEELWVVAASL